MSSTVLWDNLQMPLSIIFVVALVVERDYRPFSLFWVVSWFQSWVTDRFGPIPATIYQNQSFLISSFVNFLQYFSLKKKYKKNVNLFFPLTKVNNKDTKTMPIASSWCLCCLLWPYFTPCPNVSVVNFEYVIAGRDFLNNIRTKRTVLVLLCLPYCFLMFLGDREEARWERMG